MTDREQQVLALIREDPMLPQQAIADRLGVSRSAVAAHVMNLTSKGLIQGRGYVLSDWPFIVVIGGANVDIHGRSSKQLVGQDSNPGEVRIAAGGVARNIAENLARLGVDTRLIAAVGSDQHGQMLTSLCREAGINVQHLHTIPNATTSTYMSILDDGGDMLLAINDMAIVEQLTAELLQTHAAMLKRAALIVIDCNLQADSLAWLCNNSGDVAIFADTVSAAKAARLRPHLDKIHTLKTGTIELEALTGMQARTRRQLDKATAQLHAEGTKRVFVTRGGKGVYFSDEQKSGIRALPRKKLDIRNAGGAGDAFLAGLAYAWLAQQSVEDSIDFSQAAAEITLTHDGTNNPALSLALIQQTLEAQHA